MSVNPVFKVSDEEGKNKSEMIGYLELRGLWRFLGARRRGPWQWHVRT
jgi:hypothetical protein